MFSSTLPRVASFAAVSFAVVSLALALGSAQAQTPRIGEPAPSASKSRRATVFTPAAKKKAASKTVRADARQGAALRRAPEARKIRVNAPASRTPRVAAPTAKQLRRSPRAQTVNAPPTQRKARARRAPAPNLRLSPKAGRRAPVSVRRPGPRVNLRDCRPGDQRVECKEIVRRR